MTINEIKGDLFDQTTGRIPVHCISQDCAMGAGIALSMKKEFKLSNLTAETFPDCIYYHGVFNLVTKSKYSDKPTYSSLKESLLKMKKICMEEGFTSLVMPKIGCGLDKLNWTKVKEIIEEVFNDTSIDILVCYLT